MSVFSMAGSNPALPTYPLQRSVRLRSSASASFSRTPATAGNRKTWTWSGWVKRGQLGIVASLVSANFNTAGGLHFVYFTTTDTLNCYIELSTGIKTLWTTNAVFRDPSAWYHIVVVFDTTQAAVANMCKFYVNNVLQSATISNVSATYISQNADGWINNNTAQYLGSGQSAYTYYYDGYMTEVNFVNGQALTPSSFGAYNSYGVWSPAKYTGTYGTNGFYLNFQDNSALTTTANVGIGKDSSGNGNYWTSNNISITAGTTYDSMLDVPTLTSATNANFCTLSPIDTGGGSVTLSGANLNYSIASSTGSQVRGTMGTDLTSKWYWEYTAGSAASPTNPQVFGISTVDGQITNNSSVLRLAATIYTDGSTNYVASKYISGVTTNVTTQFRSVAIGDIMQVAYDAATGNLWFGKNNTWYDATNGTTGNPSTGANPVFTLPTGSQMTPFLVNLGATYSGSLNCGQRPFTYTPPTGYNRLCTYNLPDSIVPVGAQYMAATTYTGNGSTQAITNTVNGFSLQPDFVWYKSRSAATGNALFDSIRGALQYLGSESSAAESTLAGSLTSFNSNGFSIGNQAGTNTNGATYIGWQWRASNASAVTNTSGSITSQVSANQTAGFSIVTWTGNGSTGTIGHGLGIAPKFIITKYRNAVNAWLCYSASLGAGSRIYLNQTDAAGASATVWNNTSPTSSVFSVGDANTNASGGTYVAYCFAAVPGYSAFGSYTGNGSADGPFVYCGFRPRFILLKLTSSAGGGWYIYDTSRNTYNVMNLYLRPDASDAETTFTTLDSLSNGFKVRTTSTQFNGSGSTYIYAAFSENPFKNSLAR